MRSWLLRGLVFAFLQTLIRIIQTAMINTWETQAALISVLLQAVLAVVVLVWAYIDGRRDANAQPDPDRRADLAMTWLLAGLVAGVLSGLASLIVSLFYKNMYVMGLMNELTVFAAYTALLVFVMAMIGVALGRFLVDRRYAKEGYTSRRREGDENPDTDVFAAVGGARADATQEARTEELGLHQGRTQEARTEELGLHEGRTQEAPNPEREQ
ncbi:MAG TPA: B-4DMT family transporter [Mycobacterium sp.]|nr:B-4DMT family transporter [Mycobacterium sp.]